MLMRELSIYQTVAWRRVLTKSYGYEDLSLGAPGEPLYVPVMAVKNSILRKSVLLALPFSDLAGPVASSGVEKGFEHLSRLFDERKFDYVELKGVESEYLEVAKKWGFEEKFPNYRFLLDIRPELSEIQKKFKGTINYDLRRSESLGLEVSREVDVPSFYKLHQESMKRLGTPPHAKRFFQNIFESLGDLAFMVSVKHSGKVISSVIFLLDPDKKTSRYIFASNYHKARSLNANTVALFEGIKYSKALGAEFVDFGVSRPGSGPWGFKEKWCGDEPQRVHYLYKARAVHIDDPRDESMQKLVFIWKRFIPLWVANLIGPYMRKQLGK